MRELAEVLSRPKFERFLAVSERQDFYALFSRWVQLWEISAASRQTAEGVCRDDKDAKFLSLALTCEADALISSDADLLVLHPWQGIPILTPRAFLEKATA